MEGTRSSETKCQIREIEIKSIDTRGRTRKNLGDIDALAHSIGHRGLLHPIVVNSRYQLVVGGRRLAAFKKLGRKTIPAIVNPSFEELAAILQAERDENTCRKDFTPTEAVELAQKIKPLLEKEAKERQESGKSSDGQAGGRGRKKPPSDSDEGLADESNEDQPNKPSRNFRTGLQPSGRTADAIAAAVGMSGRTLEKAEAVVDAAKEDPEQFGDLPKQMDETGKVDGAYREMRRRQSPPKPEPRYPLSDAYTKVLNDIVGVLNGFRKGYGGIQNMIKRDDWDPDETEIMGQLIRACRDALDRAAKELEG